MLSTTAIRELTKLPLLAEHYYAHFEENSQTTLIGFLVKHYCLETGTDKDAAEDSKLPFKSVESIVTAFFISLPPTTITSSLTKFTSCSTVVFFIHNDAFISSQYLAAIWQPPKMQVYFFNTV